MAACEVVTAPYQVAFVTSIPVTGVAVTGLSLSSDPWCVAEGTRFDPPSLRRAEVSTLLVDGEQYPATAYDNRTISLRLAVQTANPDDLATQLQLLHRQLDKATNILRVQPKTTEPVYFRTFRAPPEAINVIPRDRRTAIVEVDLPAEPFGYGPKITLTPITVTNDPATGVANGMYFDVTGVRGDVETPLFLAIPATELLPGGGSTAGEITSIGVRRRGTPANAPLVLQAELGTAGTDTSLPGNDPLMSGSGPNYMRTTFATTTAMALRWSRTTFPDNPSVDTRGTYRVFARTRHSVAGDTIQIRLYASFNGQVVNGETVALTNSTNVRYADLGLLQFPSGTDPVTDGYSGEELAAGGMTVGVSAARVSGSGNLDVDLLLFVPADDRLAMVTWSLFSGPTTFVLDSARAMAYALGSTGQIRSEPPMSVIGSPPMVSPGVTNRIVFVPDVSVTNTTSDDITDTVVVAPYYWPRYLHVRPVST